MKTFILTIDYEIFLGSQTGTVEKCMIEPTNKLAEILDINNSKMTVFWDILHYYRLSELENEHPELKKDRKLIDEQISFLISKGHDIQLHLHPHWIDAVFAHGKWKFKYERFNLHALSEENNPEKIETITGCVTISKELMEREIRKHDPEYKVTTFRAGGYLIEPFIKLRRAFEDNSIYLDSSVLPGMYYDNLINGYDFRNYTDHNSYRFINSPSEFTKEGKFTEIPITTVSIPVHKNLLYTLIRRLKYPDLESGRIGTGSAESVDGRKKSKLKQFILLLTKSKKTVFTTDGNFIEKFDYMYQKVKNKSTMILHPKLLNQHTLDILRDKVTDNDIKFISINSFLQRIPDKKVAILLVLFNEEKHIERLARSIINQSYKDISVYALDNNSKDSSAALLLKYIPNAKIIRSEENLGFAKGNNIIAAEAINNNENLLFILNTDMELERDCIRNLVHIFVEKDDVIGSGPIVYYGNENGKTKNVQSYANKSNFSKARSDTIYIDPNLNLEKLPETVNVNVLHGGCFMVRSRIVSEIGLFNEDNFMYNDETDLSYRLSKLDSILVVTKNAQAWHYHDFSKKNKKGHYLQYYYMNRNRFLFFYRYKKYFSFIREILLEILLLPVKAKWAKKTAGLKLLKYYYLGYWHGLLNKKGKADFQFKE